MGMLISRKRGDKPETKAVEEEQPKKAEPKKAAASKKSAK